MKKITLLSMMAICLSALSFTSCNTDDDTPAWTPLSRAEKATCYAETSGEHTGNMIYISDEHKVNAKDNFDTLQVVNWSIESTAQDTAIVVKGIPAKIMARYIPENSENKEMKTALSQSTDDLTVRSRIMYYKTSPVAFLYTTSDAASCELEYGGATHKVSFYFYIGSVYYPYSFGVKNAQTKKQAVQMLIGGYKVDAKADDNSNPTNFSYNISNNSETLQYAQFVLTEN